MEHFNALDEVLRDPLMDHYEADDIGQPGGQPSQEEWAQLAEQLQEREDQQMQMKAERGTSSWWRKQRRGGRTSEPAMTVRMQAASSSAG